MGVSTMIRQARKGKHWTQAVLARKVGAARETVALWETGSHYPSPIFRRQLKRVLKIDLEMGNEQ